MKTIKRIGNSNVTSSKKDREFPSVFGPQHIFTINMVKDDQNKLNELLNK